MSLNSNSSATLTKAFVEKSLRDKHCDRFTIVPVTDKNSEVWKSGRFGMVVAKAPEQDKIADFAACVSCFTVFTAKANTGTSALKRHSCKKPDATIQSQPTITSMFAPKIHAVVPGSVQKAMTKSLVRMCASDLRPFNVINGDGFRHMLNTALQLQHQSKSLLDLDQLLCSDRTISRTAIKEADLIRLKLKTSLELHFESGGHAAFTTDLWTDDMKKISYSSVTVHYIDKHWKLHDRTMAVAEFTVPSHTADAVRENFTNCLSLFGVEDWDRCKVVSDDGSNNTGQLGIETLFDRIPCSDHKLGVIMGKILQKWVQTVDGVKQPPVYRHADRIPEIFTMIDAVKDLVKYVKQAELQDELDTTVKQENATRWNSLLTCLVSVLKTWDSLTRCLENRRQSRRILCIDKSLLIELIDFLTVFQTATLTLEAFKTPTIHLVAYQRHLCSLGCNPRLADDISIDAEGNSITNRKDSEEIVILKSLVRQSLYAKWDLDVMHVVGALLDPRMRVRVERFGVSGTQSTEAKTRLRHLIAARVVREDFAVIDNSLSNRGRKRKSYQAGAASVSICGSSDEGSEPDCDNALADVNLDEQSRLEIADVELNKYWDLKLAKIDKIENLDVLSWWKRHELALPILARVSRDVLAIPASSSKSECNFSDAGNTMTVKRAAMGPKTLDALMVLKSAYDYES